MYGDGRDGVIIEQAVEIIRFRDITDGTSHTLLIGEKRMNYNYCTTDQQPDDNDGYVGGFQDDVIRFGAANTSYGPLVPGRIWSIPCSIPGAPAADSTANLGIRLVARRRVPVCFVRRSVQSIAYTIDPWMFQYWAVRNDGFSTQLPTE